MFLFPKSCEIYQNIDYLLKLQARSRKIFLGDTQERIGLKGSSHYLFIYLHIKKSNAAFSIIY